MRDGNVRRAFRGLYNLNSKVFYPSDESQQGDAFLFLQHTNNDRVVDFD